MGVAGGGQSSNSRQPPSPCTCSATGSIGQEPGLVAQVGVEPVERGVGHPALAAATEVATGADAQVHRRGRVAEDRVVGEHAGQRVVVPAVDEQDRHLPVGEHPAEVDRGPERVVGPAVRELVLVEREVLAGHVTDDVAERQVVEAGAELRPCAAPRPRA